MGLIRVHQDPFGDARPQAHAWDGELIGWLLERYPDGFDRPHQARLNGELLAVEDYDTALGDGAVVDLVLYPAAPVVAAVAAINWVQVAVGLAVSVAVNYAANAIFGAKPKQSIAGVRSLRTPAPGSVYGINAPYNEARIGQPIECQYGRVRSVPSLATSPYTYYDANNTQWLAVILRLGHGQHQVHEVYASDTPVSQMKPGTVDLRVWQPQDHQGAWGIIGGATGIHEDVDTSVEVTDIELSPGSWLTVQAIINYEASTLYFASPLPADIVVGGQVRISFQTTWLVTFTIASIAADRKSLTTVQSLDSYGDSSVAVHETSGVWSYPEYAGYRTRVEYLSATDLSPWVGARISATLADAGEATQTLNGTILSAGPGYVVIDAALPWPIAFITNDWDSFTASIQLNTSLSVTLIRGGAVAGPYVVCTEERVTRLVGFDFVWPSGLYRLNDEDGSLLVATVNLTLTLEEIDDAGDLTGGPGYVQSYTYSAATNTPQRKTVWMACGGKRYRASVIRTNPGTGRAQDQFGTHWTGLKAVLEHWGQAAYGEVTLISMLVRATEGLSPDAAQRISVDSTRVLEGAPTTNPAAAVRDLWTNTEYGAGRSLAELDAVALAELEADAVGHNGFNFRFESHLSVWKALQAIVRPVNYYPVPLGGMVSFAKDAPTDVISAYFRDAEDERGPANMYEVSVSMQWDEPGAPDGYEVEYINPVRGMPAYTVYPPDAADPETVTLDGCTDEATAEAFAAGLWARHIYRREWLQWQTELEGAILALGAKVAISSRLVGTEVPYIIQSVEPGEGGRHTISAWRYGVRQYG